jgi:hypothetical protein
MLNSPHPSIRTSPGSVSTLAVLALALLVPAFASAAPTGADVPDSAAWQHVPVAPAAGAPPAALVPSSVAPAPSSVAPAAGAPPAALVPSSSVAPAPSSVAPAAGASPAVPAAGAPPAPASSVVPDRPVASVAPAAPAAAPASCFMGLCAKRRSDPSRPAISRDVGPGILSMNLYADFGYAFGPQRKHRYYDYITKKTVEDFGRRDFTSYPLYVNQFSLAYAYVQGQYEIPNKLRFRLALHAGHTVDSLYNEEMKALQMIREAAIYYFFVPKLAMEAGIFPSYFGAEIILNKENMHATRAYIADYTPDYEAGVRLHYHVRQDMTLRFMVLNGWQEIRDQNGKKALGFVWSVNRPNKIVGDWNMYWGNEAPLGAKEPMFRHYQNLYYRIWLGKRWLIFPMFDFVMQKNNVTGKFDFVVSPAFSVRYAVWAKVGVALRWDYLYNKADIVPELKTGTANGWQSNSLTATLEYLPLPQFTLRLEGRYGTNKDAVFRNRTNVLVREDYYGIVSAAFHF